MWSGRPLTWAIYFLGLALIVASFVLAYRPLRGAHAS
jgi:hypothetical protein